MLNTRYTTKRELAAIKQAVSIIDSGKTNHGYNTHLWKSKGWTGPHKGVFKRAFIKNGIVVKLGPKIQIKRELRLWLATRNNPAKRKYRKNLARCYGIYKGWLFQKYVKSHPKENNIDCHMIKCGRVARALRIYDWGNHNHRHDKSLNPIWFDTYDWW